MKKLLIQLFFTSLSLQAMYSSYSHEFKTYSLDTMPAYLMNNSEESIPSRVYFQVTATEKPFYIPVIPKRHEPSILDQKIIKRAAYYEKLLYQGIDSVSRLRDELKKIKHDYDSTKNGLGRSDKIFFEKQIEMLESYLSKYGIECLSNIQRAHNAEQAIESFNLLAADTSVDSKLVQAAKRALNLREDYHQYLQHNQQELIASLDMVSTPVYPVANFSPEIDARIEKELSAIKYRDGDSFQHYNEIKTVLNEMKNQGLLDVPKDMVPGALIHCILHFIKQFEPTNPLDHPKEFTKSAIKYAAMSVFHIATDGAFLGLEKATALATQVHELMQQDFSDLTPNARAELIAEQVADIVKCVLADQIGKRVLPNTQLPGLPRSSSMPHEVVEVTTSEGEKFVVIQKKDFDVSSKRISSLNVLQNKKTIQDLVERATRGRITSGPSRQYQLSGGLQNAIADFESLYLNNVRDISDVYGFKKMGFLDDGTKVLVRGYSTASDAPTLEIQYSKNRILKFRY